MTCGVKRESNTCRMREANPSIEHPIPDTQGALAQALRNEGDLG